MMADLVELFCGGRKKKKKNTRGRKEKRRGERKFLIVAKHKQDSFQVR